MTRPKAGGAPKVTKPGGDSTLATSIARDQALQCSDVVEAIFDEMEVWPDSERYPACARCARVCRSFYRPATRVLWSSLSDEGMFPLWSIFTQRKRTSRSLPLDGHCFDSIVTEKAYLQRDLWERFLYYGSLVRELVWHSGLLSPGESTACRMLVDHNDDRTFLPNLRALTWFHSRDVEHNEAIIMLIPPNLDVLNIWMNVCYANTTDLVNATESALHPVADRCPSLRYLNLRIQYISAEHLLPVLCRFKNVHDLRVNHMEWAARGYFRSADTCQLLASLPCLHRLDISVAEFNRTPPVPITHPQLRFLRCSGASADLATFAALLRVPRLTVFWAYCTNQEATRLSDFQLLVRSALSPSFSGSLSRFYAEQEYLYDRITTEDTSSYETASFMDILSPMPSLAHMVDFSIGIASQRFMLSLTDNDLLALGRAMPRLRTFRLMPLSAQSPRVPSPRGLMQFAVDCPDLEVLGLGALRGAPIEMPSRVPSTEHPLVELILKEATTPVKEPKKLATYLHTLFPALNDFVPPSLPVNAIAGWSATKRIHTSLTRGKK
ncbi:hypothetical protein C8Q73DRAFT_495081 [Cubamyces lactineus]|nr:hypothetical protein C8Q73DRAFT_495081 [Cubamyces lactineus]